jgi:ABC-2 type transport system ATP-binding protein
MIQITNVSMLFPVPKRYRDYLLRPFAKSKHFVALERVDLEINDGDRVAFLGVNGAGKTTLLKLVGGLLYPSSGAIVIDGYDTVRHNLKARQNVGFVLNEERSFYWRLSGLENLFFFGTLDNLYGAGLQEKTRELISLVGLEKAAHKPVATYSSGMKQRLAIARGLLCDPKILILDEPTRTLDPEAVEDVKRLVSKKIHESQQRTLLISTHRFDEVEALCNKVCVMKNGKLMAYRRVEEIKAESGSIADFYYHTIAAREAVAT